MEFGPPAYDDRNRGVVFGAWISPVFGLCSEGICQFVRAARTAATDNPNGRRVLSDWAGQQGSQHPHPSLRAAPFARATRPKRQLFQKQSKIQNSPHRHNHPTLYLNCPQSQSSAGRDTVSIARPHRPYLQAAATRPPKCPKCPKLSKDCPNCPHNRPDCPKSVLKMSNNDQKLSKNEPLANIAINNSLAVPKLTPTICKHLATLGIEVEALYREHKPLAESTQTQLAALGIAPAYFSAY